MNFLPARNKKPTFFQKSIGEIGSVNNSEKNTTLLKSQGVKSNFYK